MTSLPDLRRVAEEAMSPLETLGATEDVLGSYRRGVNVGHEKAVHRVTEWMVEHGYQVGENESLNTLLFELDRMVKEPLLTRIETAEALLLEVLIVADDADYEGIGLDELGGAILDVSTRIRAHLSETKP